MAIDDVEGGRRAEIDDDRRPTVVVVSRHAIDDAVGAELSRLLDVELQTYVQIAIDDDGLESETIPRHFDQPGRHVWHYARDDDAVNFLQAPALGSQESSDEAKP